MFTFSFFFYSVIFSCLLYGFLFVINKNIFQEIIPECDVFIFIKRYIEIVLAVTEEFEGEKSLTRAAYRPNYSQERNRFTCWLIFTGKRMRIIMSLECLSAGRTPRVLVSHRTNPKRRTSQQSQRNICFRGCISQKNFIYMADWAGLNVLNSSMRVQILLNLLNHGPSFQ